MHKHDDILPDFLLEAQEILDNLDSQLVALESAPDDQALLNAVFRGFHTIKGGAGFLSLEPLVQVAHKAEDVFDLLRNGRCRLDAGIMDLFLTVLDALRGMFDTLRLGEPPAFADPVLIAKLVALGRGEIPPAAAAKEAAAVTLPAAGPVVAEDAAAFDAVVAAMIASEHAEGATLPDASADLITDDEFESLLDKLHGVPVASPHAQSADAAPAPAATNADEITDDEFEALLDKLHGTVAPAPAAAAVSPPPTAGQLITDAEFENLLDRMHGTGRFDPAAAGPAIITAPAAMPAVAPARPAAAPATRKPQTAEGENTIRVGTEVLDRIMNLVGELVLIRNRLENLQATIGNPEMTQAVANLDVVTSDLQMAAMKTRMQPIKKVFGRFPRVVRDLARGLHKEIELQIIGEDTDLDKNLVEALADPLVHLVRNACDHGIELPDERVAAGKPRSGRLTLAAEQIGDQIVLTIEDDGKGMNAEVLRAKSVEKGLLDEDAAARLSERECLELIFLPGFSTKEQISDMSGRGVGMDVVKTRIGQLNGAIQIDSSLGQGATIRISVPLTLAIMPTLMVMLGRQVFALPLVNVKEILDFKRDDACDVNGRKTLVVRDRALPLFYMSRWLVHGVNDVLADRGHVVVVSIGSQQIGLLVDELIGQEEVIIKPLGIMLQRTKGLSGSTITGNGRIALILDLPDLIDAYGTR